MDPAAYEEYLETLDCMDVLAELAALEASGRVSSARHIGPSESDLAAMLHAVGCGDAGRPGGQDRAAGDPQQPAAGPAAAASTRRR